MTTGRGELRGTHLVGHPVLSVIGPLRGLIRPWERLILPLVNAGLERSLELGRVGESGLKTERWRGEEVELLLRLVSTAKLQEARLTDFFCG